jgi:HlyD family secretion protein
MKKYTWLIILIIIVIILALLFVPLHKKAPLKTIAVKKGSVSQKVIAVGQILPLNLTKIKSHIPGQVGQLFADEGDYVKQGEKLLTITPTTAPVDLAQARSDVGTARADLNDAKAQLDREKQLLATHQIISADKNYSDALQAYQSALSTYNYSQQKLELLQSGQTTIGDEHVANVIYSPVNGYVLERNIDVGDSVVPVTDSQAGTVLFVIANLKPLIFKGEVSQIDVNHVKPGMSASLTIASLPKQKIMGRVQSVSLMDANQSDNSNNGSASNNVFDTPDVYTHGFSIKIDKLQIPKDVALRAGYQATATIVTQKKTSVLVLPQGAVHFNDSNKPYVEVLDAHGRQQKRMIKVGLSDNSNAEITSGLKLGDKVVDQ